MMKMETMTYKEYLEEQLERETEKTEQERIKKEIQEIEEKEGNKMKQIEEYIESNKKLLKKAIEKRKIASGEDEKRIMIQIERLYYYIKGLEDAKKYIEEEEK